LGLDGNYGVNGRTFGHSHGSFTAAVALNIPIFQGGKVQADTLQADTLLERRRAELEDTRGRVDSEVRQAFLDVQSAADQVEVTRKETELAAETLTQARDRFAAGVANNLEVVQAQEALANANETYIDSVYAHNIAKAALARAVGLAEISIKEFLAEMH
jgi:outer membrane protein TolC